jgi:prolyl-tRNA synthetase
VWEQIQAFLDSEFKKHGVKNAYFPMFVKKKNLEAEKEHVEGFSAEVAWVTHSGNSKLAEPIAIRPTSETIMYPSFAKWIHSHRDLPLKLNQWTNVVRWEFKHPTPFIRTREFLWQEGHTAHATKEESDKMVHDMLDVYANCYQNLLAIPVIKGRKSRNEKFAGADYTTTCETFVAENGRAIQACTSHNLGQNFAKMFNVEFEDLEMKKQLVYQTSWGFTTRSIGLVIMIHGDDKGVVFPPKVAPVQTVIVPIFYKDKDNAGVDKKCKEIAQSLIDAGIRTEYDDRPNYSAGWKYNDWEMKGVTLRIEVGPNDLVNKEARLVRRLDNHKQQVKLDDLIPAIKAQLNEAHNLMFANAQAKLKASVIPAESWKEFMTQLNNLKVVQTPWCEDPECEDKVKERSGVESKMEKNQDVNMSGAAKTLCLPFEQPALKADAPCFHCGKKATKWVLWGRSY